MFLLIMPKKKWWQSRASKEKKSKKLSRKKINKIRITFKRIKTIQRKTYKLNLWWLLLTGLALLKSSDTLKIKLNNSCFHRSFLAGAESISEDSIKPHNFYMTNIFDDTNSSRHLLRTTGEICSKLVIKIPGRRQWCRDCIFIVNLGHILLIVLMIRLLTLKK